MLSLREICMQRMIEQLKSAPESIQQEILGRTKESMKKDIKKEVLGEVRSSIPVLVCSNVDEYIRSINEGGPRKKNKLQYKDKQIGNTVQSVGDEITRHVIDRHFDIPRMGVPYRNFGYDYGSDGENSDESMYDDDYSYNF